MLRAIAWILFISALFTPHGYSRDDRRVDSRSVRFASDV